MPNFPHDDLLVDPAAASLAIAPGRPCRIVLSEASGAGYLWHLEELPKFVRVLDEPAAPAPAARPDPESIVVGGHSTRVFRFEATGPGSGRLALSMRRPWERAGAPAAEVAIDVVCPSEAP